MSSNISKAEISMLRRLSGLYGVQTSYYDVSQHLQRATPESLLSMLKALGAPIESLTDVSHAWREKQQAVWQLALEPVIVVWDNKPTVVEIRLPSSVRITGLSYSIQLENGEELKGQWNDTEKSIFKKKNIEGVAYVVRHFRLPFKLSFGYHRLIVELNGRYSESLIISAPVKAYDPGNVNNRIWGIFSPLYAQRTQNNWGSGDYSDLLELIDWLNGFGGQVISMLPLLAGSLELDGDCSPYRPSSRLFWNEFYVDINKVPELNNCASAQTIMSSQSFQNELDEMRRLPLVDYKRAMTVKRRVLEELSNCLFYQGSGRLEDLQRFTETHPGLENYARFRAVGEANKNSVWRSWPQPLSDGIIGKDDYDEKQKQYHLYVQWLASQQLDITSEKAKEKAVQLYLDLPLGVHPDGYDVWSESDSFIREAEVGAPPDTVFTRGQNWEFPPLHPRNIRDQGYRYVIAYLRHNMEHSDILRIDHVMGLHRLFCIPKGIESSQGVYLRYHAEEIYAILAIESRRNKTVIVGENLGMVPWYVEPAMKKHGFNSMYVLRYEMASGQKYIRPVPPDSVAGLNTHDMPPFASFWQGLDIEQRLALGLLEEPQAQAERVNLPNVRNTIINTLRSEGWLKEPEDNVAAVLKACLAYLAASPAQAVLINLEDLWLETQPQNVPSTRKEYPNWEKKMHLTFDEFCQMPQVVDILHTVDNLRRRGNPGNTKK